jgi:S-formylglutathione hydrolase
VPWGQKAFAAYLGDDPAAWAAHDTVALIAQATERLPLWVDQGEADDFLRVQLRPELLRAACEAAGHPLTLRIHPDHDHSYYFIASFIGEHVAWHAQALGTAPRIS